MAPRDQTDSDGYLDGEIQGLIDHLEGAFKVRFTEEAFADSVALYRQTRDLCIRLEQAVAAGSVGFDRFARTVQAGALLPVEEHIQALTDCLDAQSDSPPDGGRLFLSGIRAPHASVSELFHRAGLRIVGNDIATLWRSYGTTPEEFDSVQDYYRRFYSGHAPCTTLLYTADKRTTTLLGRLQDTGARGFVFLGEKFCEYEYFEIPGLARLLQEKGYGMLQLEFALEDERASENLKTRIEAFAETIGG
jgi:benzoyl-CoA reductase/2-hydroxyglutaryl-CoA dehydratase subunit BcrC/BadD/HgdB